MDKKRNFRLIKNMDWQDPISAVKGMKRINYVLENGSVEEIKRLKAKHEELIEFHWKYYQELALQRERIKDKIFDTLLTSCKRGYQFEKFQRAVKYKYSLHPLCSIGSIAPPGGRFNVGDVNSSIKQVHALYIASDKDTALQEALGQEPVKGQTLSARELALTNPQSETIVSVTGQLDYLLDLRTHHALTRFISLIKNFKISPALKKEAKRLGLHEPKVIDKATLLHGVLMTPNWRHLAALFDIPWNSQIFGNLCAEAGVHGIAYKSSKNGKECMAIFPLNFAGGTSIVVIDDEAPVQVKVTRLDATNFYQSLFTHDQLAK